MKKVINGEVLDMTADDIAMLNQMVASIKPLVPQTISKRQFFQQLAVDGIITDDDFLAALTGTIPAPLMAIVNALPSDQQLTAKGILIGGQTYERNNPLTISIATASGKTDAQTDAFFIAANQL